MTETHMCSPQLTVIINWYLLLPIHCIVHSKWYFGCSKNSDYY